MTRNSERVKVELELVIGECLQRALGLKDTLIEERDALKRQDSAAILDAASRKKSYIEDLERLDAERAALTEAGGFGRSPGDMQTVARKFDSAGGDTALLNRWNRFMDIAQQCFDLNSANGAIIRVRKMQITNSLATIRGATSDDHTYGPAGSEPTAERARSLAQA
ncbi:MAG: flagellar protein FlgN [Gammaproteobacteria bacterium]|nr:flagellar protein FlgN [Gammaproteobacteria bacterium]